VTDEARLFPELRAGVPLNWYAFQFVDDSYSRDPGRAIAARRAGQFVRLIPKTVLAYYWMSRDHRSASRP
jgi:hypothetical protein